MRHIRYASINKRVRLLVESGYIKKASVKQTKAGFQASVYELTTNACLAVLLNSINPDGLLMRIDEATAQTILAAILG